MFLDDLQPRSNYPRDVDSRYLLYELEKDTFAGFLLASILYGALCVVFFQCLATLLNPVYRRGEGIKWGLVTYTVAMFSFVTVYTGITLHIQSVSFIDERQYTYGGMMFGPLGYQSTIRRTVLGMLTTVMFVLNYWLADGLLLYRCYVIYAKNLWVIVIPCILYLGSIAMGILMLTYQGVGFAVGSPIYPTYGIPYLSISVSLNLLLTTMIVVRLVLHSRDIRATMGTPGGFGGLYKTIATMMIESSAAYTISSLLVLGPMAANSLAVNIFYPVLAETQVIAPLLIIQRVANKSAFMGGTTASANVGSFHFGSRGRTTGGSGGGGGIPPGGYPLGAVDKYGEISGELRVGVKTEATVDSHRSSASDV